MGDKKICVDCGKHFISESQNIIICEHCMLLSKKRFWSSIKIGQYYNDH
jgi:DNA-directed RNA polymerase subunit RPC12/RpoP